MIKPVSASNRKLFLTITVIFAVLGIIVNTGMIIIVGISSVKAILCYVTALMLHISIIQYIVKYYKKGHIDKTLSGILIRFAVSAVASLMTARNGNDIMFIMLTVIVFLVPYMAGDLTQTKRGTCIVFVVLVLITIVTIMRVDCLSDYNEAADSFLKKAFLYLNECNQLIEWISISMLYFSRVRPIENYINKGEAKQ